jgi:hypothetical protein
MRLNKPELDSFRSLEPVCKSSAHSKAKSKVLEEKFLAAQQTALFWLP